LVVSALASKLVLIFKKKFKVAAVPTQELEQKVTFQASRPRTHQSGFLHGNKYTYIHIYIHTHIYIYIYTFVVYICEKAIRTYKHRVFGVQNEIPASNGSIRFSIKGI
jgi:hypothetical protein